MAAICATQGGEEGSVTSDERVGKMELHTNRASAVHGAMRGFASSATAHRSENGNSLDDVACGTPSHPAVTTSPLHVCALTAALSMLCPHASLLLQLGDPSDPWSNSHVKTVTGSSADRSRPNRPGGSAQQGSCQRTQNRHE